MKYTQDFIPKGQDSQKIRPTQIILHSLANGWNWDAGLGWLRSPGNSLESHVVIRKDGYRVQLVPYDVRADANYKANRRPDGTGAISIETDSSIAATEPWTDDQVESITELLVDLCRRFDIPPRLCPGPDAPGIGWHIMFGSPGPWTPVAKACPGPARIRQVPAIVAEVSRRLGGTTSPAPKPTPAPDPLIQEDTMIVVRTTSTAGLLTGSGIRYIDTISALAEFQKAFPTVIVSDAFWNTNRAPGCPAVGGKK